MNNHREVVDILCYFPLLVDFKSTSGCIQLKSNMFLFYFDEN